MAEEFCPVVYDFIWDLIELQSKTKKLITERGWDFMHIEIWIK